MNINVAKQRILLIKDQITPDEATAKAWDKKAGAFDTLSKVASFLSRPKDEDFELTYTEHRYQPFWHIMAQAKYVYDRNTNYQVPLTGKEVRSVTLLDNEYQETNGHIHIPVTEHCIQEEQDETYVDGVNGKPARELAVYVQKPVTEVTEKIESLIEENAIVVPPQARVSAIMRETLAKMIKGIQADTILEEQIEVPVVDLYYRPVYAFQFTWKSKGKDAILEIDGVTGNVSSGNKVFREYLGKVLDQDFLFDIGADAAGMLIPGGSIAVKAARKYIEAKK